MTWIENDIVNVDDKISRILNLKRVVEKRKLNDNLNIIKRIDNYMMLYNRFMDKKEITNYMRVKKRINVPNEMDGYLC